jgi:hypothetical protein
MAMDPDMDNWVVVSLGTASVAVQQRNNRSGDPQTVCAFVLPSEFIECCLTHCRPAASSGLWYRQVDIKTGSQRRHMEYHQDPSST